MGVKPLDNSTLISTLLGVVVGAFASAGCQHLFWRVQHREALRASEEHAKREVTERLRRTGIELIELARAPLPTGVDFDNKYFTTTNRIELYKLRRELIGVCASFREVFPEEGEPLRIFQNFVDTAIASPSDDQAKRLRDELDVILQRNDAT